MKFALTLALLLSTPCVAQPPIIRADVDTTQRESPFQSAAFARFAREAFHCRAPLVSAAEMGYGGRLIKGQLLDETNQPMGGVSVVLMSAPGVKRGVEYLEQFAVTDGDGKFELVATTTRHRVIFHEFDEAEDVFWVAKPTDATELQEFTKPKTATLNWIAPPEVIKSNKTIAIRPKRELAAGVAPVTYVDKNAEAAFTAKVMPGEYIVTFNYPDLLTNRRLLPVEIATLTAEPGAVAVPRLPEPVAGIGGMSKDPNDKQYITVQRAVAAPVYHDVWSWAVVDVVRPAKGGFFLTKRLPVGKYIVKLQDTSRPPTAPIAAWCVQMEADSKSINLSKLPPPTILRGKIEALLASRGDYSGISHLIFDLTPDSEAIVRTLGEMATDQNSPWQRRAGGWLSDQCEDSIVLAKELLKLTPEVPFSARNYIAHRIGDFSTDVAPLIELLTPLVATKNDVMRPHVFIALEELAAGNPEHADRVTEILEIAIKRPDLQTRRDAAFSLGRLKAKSSLPLLRELRDEDIEAAFLVWQMDGDAKAFFSIADAFLQKKGLLQRNLACRHVAKVVEKTRMPATTRELLHALADTPADSHPSKAYNDLLKKIIRQARELLANSNPSDP